MKTLRKVYFPLAAVVLIVLDRLSKLWIVNHITLDTIQECLPGIFSLTYLRNYGAAFDLQIDNGYLRLLRLRSWAACYYLLKISTVSLVFTWFNPHYLRRFRKFLLTVCALVMLLI
mgnify:CR=1 FL=1